MIRTMVMNPKVMVKTRRVNARKMKSIFLDISLSMSYQRGVLHGPYMLDV
jgi:hypothetical protein